MSSRRIVALLLLFSASPKRAHEGPLDLPLTLGTQAQALGEAQGLCCFRALMKRLLWCRMSSGCWEELGGPCGEGCLSRMWPPHPSCRPEHRPSKPAPQPEAEEAGNRGAVICFPIGAPKYSSADPQSSLPFSKETLRNAERVRGHLPTGPVM